MPRKERGAAPDTVFSIRFFTELIGRNYRIREAGTNRPLSLEQFTAFEFLWRDRQDQYPDLYFLGISGPHKRLLHPIADKEGNSWLMASQAYTDISIEKGKLMGTLGDKKEEVEPRAKRQQS